MHLNASPFLILLDLFAISKFSAILLFNHFCCFCSFMRWIRRDRITFSVSKKVDQESNFSEFLASGGIQLGNTGNGLLNPTPRWIQMWGLNWHREWRRRPPVFPRTVLCHTEYTPVP
jgi:hypothetical protein